ncbi:ABC transporter permease [Dactylosporangium sp. NPDC051484]|uniref:ABC transporter permease n=1 Tax=Dactylosporangium sp. NPDC051484 TaxID=3154942 RepID=UPI003450523F
MRGRRTEAVRLHRFARTRLTVRFLLQTTVVFVTVFLMATFITFGLQGLSGLSPAHLKLSDDATQAQIDELNHEWGLDRPFVTQYLDWLGAIVHGDLGKSWYNGAAITELLVDRAAVSLSVALLALVIGIVAGGVLGGVAARFHTRWIDRLITGFTSLMAIIPAFVVGILLVAVFAATFKLLPAAGYMTIAEGGIGGWLRFLWLPAIALSFDTVADVARQLRIGLIQAYRENYVTGAVLRGLSGARIFFVHVLRNAVGPTLAILGLKFPNLIGGAVVTEAIFGLTGYGQFAAASANRGDVPAVQGVLVLAIVLVVAFNLLVNVILARLIPAASRGI